MDAKRVRLSPNLVIALALLALTGTSMACRTFTVDFTGTRPGATAVLKLTETPDLVQENARLKTRVAELEATLQASPTLEKTETQAAAEQASETPQASQAVLHIQYYAPMIFAGAIHTPERQISGWVVLEEGRCCVGGITGQVVQVRADFQASSPVAEVTEMRVRPGSQFYDEQEMHAAPWEPFKNQEEFPVPVAANWVGFYVSVQYRDALGNLSPVYHDDVSIEGMPAMPTLTPTLPATSNP